MTTAAAARSATTDGQLVEIDALVAPAGDQHDRRIEGAERGDDRVRLGALRVVHEAHAIDDRDRFEPVLDALERGGGLPDRVRLDAEQESDGHGGQRVGHVVRPRHRQLGERHDPTVRSGGRCISARQGQPLHAVRHDPAIHDADATGERSVAAVQHGRGGAEARVIRDHRVLGIEHEGTVGRHELGQPPLDCTVRTRASRGGPGGRT